MEYWNEVFALQENIPKYPVLSKMIKAVLTCFHGPAVESTFNLMNDMTENRTSLNIETVDSIQTIKYYLNSKDKTTCDLFGSKDPAHEPINRELAVNLLNSWSTYQNILSKKKNTSQPAANSQCDTDPTPQCITLSTEKSFECSADAEIEMPGPTSHCELGGIKSKLRLDIKAKKQAKISPFFKK